MITRSKTMADLNSIQELLQQVKNDLASKASTAQIDEILNTLKEIDERISKLEELVARQETMIILMDHKLDDIESYGRRQNLRIIGIPMPGNGVRESDNDCLEKVKKEVQKLDVMGNIPDCVFDWAHRAGKGIVDENGKVTSKPMIVRFVSWRARSAIYRARKKDGNVKIYMDLTERRFMLKKLAQDRIKGNSSVDFAFADVNNNICLRLKNGQFKFVNSKEELTKSFVI